MAWIQVHQALLSHRKTLRCADILDLPEVYIVGHLVAVWTWAIDNADGGVLDVSDRIIAKAAQWTGDPAKFVDCMVEVGYFDRDDDSVVHIHDWDDYAGKLIDRRKRNTLSMRRSRDNSVSNTCEPQDVHVGNECKARVEKSREEKKNTPLVPLEGGKAAIASPTDDNSAESEEGPVDPPKVKVPRAGPDIPTLPECREYFVASGYTTLHADDFWHYWESVGWKRGVKVMTKWRAAAAQEWIKIRGRGFVPSLPVPGGPPITESPPAPKLRCLTEDEEWRAELAMRGITEYVDSIGGENGRISKISGPGITVESTGPT